MTTTPDLPRSTTELDEFDAAEDEVLTDEADEDEDAERPVFYRGIRLFLHKYGRHWPIVVVLGGTAILCRIFIEPGHDWGDDFALYINQARGIAEGNVGEVVSNNRYSINNSGWDSFSPLVYPWGFPLMLAPVIALWGVDYAKLKLVTVFSFLGFLACMYRLIETRAGRWPATLICALFGTSIIYVGWTNQVLSEFPFAFVSALALVWMDRVRRRDLIEGDKRADLVILGLIVALSFSTRREGLALVASLVAMHGVHLGPRIWRWFMKGEPVSIRWARILMPYWVLALAVGGLQLALPSVLYPNFPGTGFHQVKPNLIWFRDILAEMLGLKDVGAPTLELFGAWWPAALAIALFLSLAVIGFFARLVTALKEDATIAAFLFGVAFVVLRAPFHEGRYLYVAVPFLAYFAYQALPSLFSWSKQLMRPAAVVSFCLIAVLVLATGSDVRHWIKGHLDQTWDTNGPTTPAAVEMADAVKRCTKGNDVVAFFRARALSMLTDRKAIQSGDINLITQRADWYMMNVGSTYSQPLVDDAMAADLGLEKVWQNAEWVLWLIPGGAADGRTLPCAL